MNYSNTLCSNLKSALLCCLKINILIFLVANQLYAQVSFTNANGLVSGFSAEDCVLDMNGDFLDDVVIINSNNLNIHYQQADGSFISEVHPVGFQNSPSWSVCGGDIDGNGYNDLLFGGGNAVSFVYANDSGTSYSEVYMSEYIFSQRSTFADIDNDGHLDAFVCHDVDQSHPYRNDGNGNLILDQSLIETVDQAGNYAAIWVDYDNDWDTDLYVTKCRGGASPGDPERTNRLYRNNGDGTYSEVAEEANLADNAQSWATVFEDFDNDGDFDAFIVNHDEQNRLYRNNGDGTFTDTILNSGINPDHLGAWENSSGDFNNDGFIDIFAEMDHEIYLNNGDWTFTGVDIGFNDGGIGDLNNDGFLDVYGNGMARLNDGNDNNWIKINTLGIVSNKNGIGARVEIHGSWGTQIREVRAGTSFSPMSSLCTHFGIGQADAIDQIIIKWPSGMETVLDNPAINTTHNIPEASCLLAEATLNLDGEIPLCQGNTITLEAPSGYASYLWSDGSTTPTIEANEDRNYSCTLTDAEGCLALSNQVSISFIEEITPAISYDGETNICAGSSILLTATGEGDFEWSTGAVGSSIEVTESGSYQVTTMSVCSDQQLVSETVDVAVSTVALPVVEDIALLEQNSFLLTASGENLQWYDAPTGGQLLGTGPEYQTPPLTEDAYYYVQSYQVIGGALQNGGRPDNQGGGSTSTADAYSYFDVWEPFTIKNVTVYVEEDAGPGERHIQLVDESDIVLQEAIFDLPSIGEHQLVLNFEVPVGTNFSLRCPENSLFRNNSNVSYPYAIGDVGELTTSFYGESYYYYFYNWIIKKQSFECTSEPVEVAVLLNDVTQIEGLENISLFPNPAETESVLSMDITAPVKKAALALYDLTGKMIWEKQLGMLSLGNQRVKVELAGLSKGMYQLHLNLDGKELPLKLVVQ